MGLESATYVSDLASSNPLAGDVRAQGDDHLRLLKSVLQTTFPNASKPFRFPATLAAQTSNYTVLSSDAGKVIPVSASGGAVTLTLPSAPDDGFYILAIKTDSSVNAVTVDGSGSDTINGALTQTLTMQYEAMLLWWHTAASAWYGFRMRVPTRNLRSSETDLNNFTTAGDYDVPASTTNAPDSGAWHVQVYVSSQDTNNILQIATDYDTASGLTYLRTKVGGSWGSWSAFAKVGSANAFTGNNTFAGTSEHTKQANFTPRVQLTDGASIAWNLETAQVAYVTLGGNRALAAPTNMKSGGTYILFALQDGTGSRTLSYDSVYKWPGGTDPVLSTGASSVDILTFVSDGTNMYGVCQKAFS